MKREDIARLFEGATDAQISALLDINSADIGKAKGDAGKLQADLAAANAALETANGTIKALEAAKGNAEALQAEVDKYKQAEADRKAEQSAKEAHAAVETRFNACAGEKKFLHELVRTGVLGEFEKALADPANAGKSDADVFSALTKDKGFFASQTTPANMGGIGTPPAGDDDRLTDAEYYAAVFQKK